VTVSTAAATGIAAFLAAARLGLALATVRFVAFPAAFLALGRAFGPFFFWTFDDCFLRLAMVDPPFGWQSANALMQDNKRQPALSRGNPLYGLSTDVLRVGMTRTMDNPARSPHNQFYRRELSRSGLRLRFHRKAK
jgi:hypothetical protein